MNSDPSRVTPALGLLGRCPYEPGGGFPHSQARLTPRSSSSWCSTPIPPPMSRERRTRREVRGQPAEHEPSRRERPSPAVGDADRPRRAWRRTAGRAPGPAASHRALRSRLGCQPRRAASIFAMSIFCIFIIASNARLAAAPIGIGDGLRQGERRDLPGQSPLVLAPAALALLAAVADDRVPVAIGLGLVGGGDLKRERFAVLERRSAVEPDAGDAHTVNSTVSTSPFLPEGKSPGARWTSPTEVSGKVLA